MLPLQLHIFFSLCRLRSWRLLQLAARPRPTVKGPSSRDSSFYYVRRCHGYDPEEDEEARLRQGVQQARRRRCFKHSSVPTSHQKADGLWHDSGKVHWRVNASKNFSSLHLLCRHYPCPKDMADDIRLVFDNAIKFNPQGHWIHKVLPGERERSQFI